MTPIIKFIGQSLENLNNKQFQQYALAYMLSLVIITCGFLYYYHSSTKALTTKIARINEQRNKTKELLERFQRVKKQQIEVNDLLEEDKEFKIGGYFSSVINQLGLQQNKTRDPVTSSIQLDNGYTEIQLYASFSNINIQKIGELLDTLEQNARIYVKELEIYKSEQNHAVNINIMIATLQAQSEQSEQME